MTLQAQLKASNTPIRVGSSARLASWFVSFEPSHIDPETRLPDKPLEIQDYLSVLNTVLASLTARVNGADLSRVGALMVHM